MSVIIRNADNTLARYCCMLLRYLVLHQLIKVRRWMLCVSRFFQLATLSIMTLKLYECP